MSRTRGVARFALLAVGSAVIACASDATSGVSDVIDHIVVSLAAPTLSVGQTVQADASVHSISGGTLSGTSLSWTTSNSGVATVSSTGLVNAVSPGTAVIKASAQGHSASANVTVVSASVAPVASVAVSLSVNTATVGQSVTATATARDAANNVLTGRTVAWNSSNGTIATVNSQGAITPVAAGTVNITATVDGVAGSAPLTVQPQPVASVTASVGIASVEPGAKTTATALVRDAGGNVLTGRAVTWSSSDITIATITATGAITGVSQGTATVTATSEGISGSVAVTVRARVVAVAVSLPNNPISANKTTSAAAVVRDSAGNTLTDRTVTWTTGNPAIASVSPTGVVTGIGPGTTIVTGTADGVPGSATLNVQSSAGSVTVALGTGSLRVGQTTSAVASVRDASGALVAGRTIAWTSSNPAVATG